MHSLAPLRSFWALCNMTSVMLAPVSWEVLWKIIFRCFWFSISRTKRHHLMPVLSHFHDVAPCCAPTLRIVILQSQSKLSAYEVTRCGCELCLVIRCPDGGSHKLGLSRPSFGCGMVVQAKGFRDESERPVRFCSCFQRVRLCCAFN